MRTQFRAPQSLRSGDGGFTHRNNDAEAGGGARTAENGEHIVGVDDGTLEELGSELAVVVKVGEGLAREADHTDGEGEREEEGHQTRGEQSLDAGHCGLFLRWCW
jgi:hypothetical protein